MTNIIKTNLDLIGSTPILNIDLKVSKIKVLAKLESFNLTGSIKDRMAFYMLKQAVKKGELESGGTIIEATTGNTGISFAALALIFGYKMIAVMPENMSRERIKLLQLYKAEVVLTPKNLGPKGAIQQRNRLAKRIFKSWKPKQFSNPDNIKAYELGIGREIVNQYSGWLDYFIHGIGTGGTLMGIAKAIKTKWPKVKIIAVEPKESAVLSGGKPGFHNIQGIGEGFIPSLVDKSIIDEVIKVSTHEAVKETKMLLETNGVFAGFSSGANIAGIKKIARATRKPATFLTIIADRGERYLSVL